MKSNVRQHILEKINALSLAEKRQQSQAIENHLKIILTEQSGCWMAYKNLKDEPEIQWDQVSTQIRWAFPKIKNDHLEFYVDAHEFNKSQFGFAEPADGIRVEIKDIQGCVLPGLAFDKKGYRLGRGKGFYDRTLPEFNRPKIGVCFKVSLCEELPHEKHDIRCDQVVTESQIFNVSQV